MTDMVKTDIGSNFHLLDLEWHITPPFFQFVGKLLISQNSHLIRLVSIFP